MQLTLFYHGTRHYLTFWRARVQTIVFMQTFVAIPRRYGAGTGYLRRTSWMSMVSLDMLDSYPGQYGGPLLSQVLVASSVPLTLMAGTMAIGVLAVKRHKAMLFEKVLPVGVSLKRMSQPSSRLCGLPLSLFIGFYG